MADYILYDDRGILSPEDASVLEAFFAHNDEQAFQTAVSSWPKHSWALYDGDELVAWATCRKKSVLRWFRQWDEPRAYNIKSGQRQKYVPRQH